MTILELTCRDPIVARDGRPFGAGQGNRMRSVGWPLPSVVAGSLRTALGKAAQREFSDATARELLQVGAAGAFPVADGSIYLPAPNDCVFHPDHGPCRAVPQMDASWGACDLPAGLHPVMLPLDKYPKEFKPKPGPAWWPLAEYAKWLTGGAVTFDRRFLASALLEERMHVAIDAATGAAKDENLFSTAALPLTHLPRFGTAETNPFAERFQPITLTARVRAENSFAAAAGRLDCLHPLGGERRLVHWRADGAADLWQPPDALKTNLVGAKFVRMVLATPAIFGDGWKPGWLNDQLIGDVPDTKVKVQLVGASIERWKAVSGWSLQPHPETGKPGPKAIRRMVPAGGVYFFEVKGGEATDLVERCWLESVCDDEQERRDGFGLAAWGTWQPS